MKVTLPNFVRSFVLLAVAILPTLEAVAQGPPGVSGSAQVPGTYSHAPAYYADPFVGYQSQSAVQTAGQRNAAMTVLENNIGYQLRAPFGPRLTFDGIFGDRRGIDGNDYSVSGFLPWHIDPNRSLAFAVLRGTATDLGDFVGNFGIGHRMYFEDLNRILGFSLWYDIDDSHNQQYNRGGAQLEYLGRYLELRAGVDIILDDNRAQVRSGFTGAPAIFQGNNVLFGFSSTQELAYDQTYAEAGGPMPFLGRYGVNAYGGAYYLWHDDANETLGWSMRASADLTRDVQVGVRHTNDDIFGHNTSVSVALSFPNGGLKQVFRSSRTIVRGQSPNLRATNQVLQLRPGSVASLMGSNVVRDHRTPVDLDTTVSNIRAIDPITGAPVCIIHVDPNSAALGNGTFESPFRTLEAARVTNDGSCRIIRVVPRGDGTGTNLAIAGTFGLFANQRLLGSSVEHTFDTTRGTFLLPGFTGPGAGPLVMNAVGGDVVRMADNTEVSGMQLVGSAGGNGIVGSPVGFDINRNEIRDALNGIMLTNATGIGFVTGNTITNSVAHGAAIANPGGGTLDVTVTDNALNNNGADGGHLSTTGGTLQGVIARNTGTGNMGNGFTVDSTGGMVDFRSAALGRVVTGNNFGGNMGDGFRVNSTGDSTVAMRFTDNDLGGSTLLSGGNMMSGLRLVADSGWHTIDVGGPVATDGNRFLGNMGTAAQFDLTGTADMTLLFQNNLIGLVSGIGDATAVRSGFDMNTLAANDDGSTGLVPIGFDANFFGTMFNQLFVNNNGNVTFNAALADFTPFPIVTNGIPIIAPFFGDVDTRQGAEVTYGQGVVDGNLAFGVNYVDVRHYDASVFNGVDAGLPTNSFQLVLVDRSDVNAGDFDIEFNYDRILWDSGEADGSDAQGLGGAPARAGYSNGTTDSFELAGTGINNAFLDSGPAATSLVNNSLNSNTLGRYVFEARNGDVTVTPVGPAVDGLQINTADASVVKSAVIDANRVNAIAGTAINVQADTGSTVNNLQITNNNILGVGRDGIRLAADNLATINLTTMTGNSATGNIGRGFVADAMGAATINIADAQGNNFSSNSGDGAFIRSNGIASVVAGGLGVNGGAMNMFNGNAGYGINLEASSGGSILGPGGAGNFAIVNNQIGMTGMGNAMGGVNAVADSDVMPPSNSVLNLAVGGPTMGDGNTIVNNMDFGVGFLTRTFAKGTVLIQNNVISDTVDNVATADPNDAMGDGIFLDRGDTSLLTAMVLNNMSINNANDGLRVLTRGDDPTNVNQPMSGMPNLVTFNNNTLTGNMRHGASFAPQADSVLLVNGMMNTITGNMMDGVNITSAGDAGFGNPAVGTRSILDGNNISMNMGNGVGVTSTDSSRVFLSIQSSDAVGQTMIMDNVLNGVAIAHTSDANSDIIIQSDPMVANTAFRTLITNNGDAMGAGGNGVLINNANGASTFTIQRTDITSNNGDGMGGNGDGIATINTGAGTPTYNIGSMINELGNLVQSNDGDGLSITTAGTSSPTYNVARNTIGAAIGQLSGGNLGHGVDVMLGGTNNAPILNFVDNDITRNTGRGANILTTGSVGQRGVAVAQVNFVDGGTGGNVVSGNGLEGIFYMADPQIATNRIVTLSNNLAGGPAFNLTPGQWPAAINAGLAVGGLPGNYDDNYRNLSTVNDSFLTVRGNTIQNNGTRGVDSDMIGGVDGDGLYVRVGTNAYVAADVQGNSFGGNLLDDFRTESFISAANAVSVNRTGQNTVDTIVLKDTAQLDLRFGGAGALVNTGNQINVSGGGVAHGNDPLTGGVNATLFQVDNGPGLNANNNFIQFLVPQDINAAYAAGPYFLRAAADPMFPNPAFPVSNPPAGAPAPFLP